MMRSEDGLSRRPLHTRAVGKPPIRHKLARDGGRTSAAKTVTASPVLGSSLFSRFLSQPSHAPKKSVLLVQYCDLTNALLASYPMQLSSCPSTVLLGRARAAPSGGRAVGVPCCAVRRASGHGVGACTSYSPLSASGRGLARLSPAFPALSRSRKTRSVRIYAAQEGGQRKVRASIRTTNRWLGTVFVKIRFCRRVLVCCKCLKAFVNGPFASILSH